MIPLMMSKGYQIGLGVDENTAAVIRGDEVEIIGDRGALVVDLSAATNKPELGAFNVTGARLSYLEHGRPLPPACLQRHARALQAAGRPA